MGTVAECRLMQLNAFSPAPARDKKTRLSITASLQKFFLESKVSSRRRDDAAKALCISDRTLSRRLQEAGTTYKEQLRQFQLACAFEHLQTGAPVKKIAYSLGFRDPSAFSHAFKRWTGQSTREYLRGEKVPMPRNWLERPSEFRIAWRAFASEVHSNNNI